eukprot:696670-Karenia_brevis.AAC.1
MVKDANTPTHQNDTESMPSVLKTKDYITENKRLKTRDCTTNILAKKFVPNRFGESSRKCMEPEAE